MSIITLLTDFGIKDPYVGIMKGVILSLDPSAVIVDISHEIEPQDIREAAFMIKEYYRFFERGAVHLAVVDPTVGSSRKPIVAAKDDRYFVGPDNGIFSLVIYRETDVYAIDNQTFMGAQMSGTFHGRDIFAPAAVHLSQGVRLSDFGNKVEKPVVLSDLFPHIDGDVMVGKIVRFDRFGNGITNMPGDALKAFVKERAFRINIGALSFDRLFGSYYEGEFTCLIGSSGYLEFGVFKGAFKERAGVVRGDRVKVERR